ncbi:hypothetical protein ATO7_09307 [Oceanococcus atlanticus]|uniref:DUF2164 domain-containing protein n=1 Tax=Oceanococcus atlanticus TaxID=1317117 RepID=A0A1Y1SE05_9GAMM|nr:DUF2164 domain-containing protein [Oceanococcus atlanticus]ORE87227.1 hypothetical protein ATO7_09307 [Oceanococcus atlanticus]
MAIVEFTQEEKDAIVNQIKLYFSEELDQEIGQFQAEFLLDFFAEKIGGAFYNVGLRDARAVLEGKLQDIDDALYEIEKPI